MAVCSLGVMVAGCSSEKPKETAVAPEAAPQAVAATPDDAALVKKYEEQNAKLRLNGDKQVIEFDWSRTKSFEATADAVAFFADLNKFTHLQRARLSGPGIDDEAIKSFGVFN